MTDLRVVEEVRVLTIKTRRLTNDTSPIPPDFGELATLVGVWLHNNQLSGESPSLLMSSPWRVAIVASRAESTMGAYV